jgi:hypothetical protein
MQKKHKMPHWLTKIQESFLSVLPIAVVITIIYFAGQDQSFSFSHDLEVYGYANELFAFLICAFLVGLGLGLFSIGVDQSLGKIGSSISSSLTKKQSIIFLVLVTFVIGFLITVAEPDLKILADETGIDNWVLILTISLGVGLFLVLGTLRIILQLDLRVVFLGVYAIAFMLVSIAPKEFFALAFDAGGVTTGPVTIPFILAFGTAVAASRQNSKSGSDDFGLIAHATMGPVLAVLILAIFIPVFNPSFSMSYTVAQISLILSPQNYASKFVTSLGDVGLAIGPLSLFFIVYDLLFLKLSPKELFKIFIGLLFCYLGLVFFLSAVQTGFSPVAQSVGKALASKEGFPLAILIGAFFGCFAVLAEPAVGVLVTQIQTVSEGTIRKGGFLLVMAISIAGAVALSVVRAYYQFSILYYLVPGYIIAFGLSFIVPNIYSSIAYDAGTVASGPMAASFAMPFVIGFASGLYSDMSEADFSSAVYQDAFGVIAMVSMLPLIVVQLVGLYAVIKTRFIYAEARKRIVEPDDDQIIHFTEEGETA